MKTLTVILASLSCLFTLYYVMSQQDISLIFALSNSLFILGILYLCIGSAIHVSNKGFFKGISYFNYKTMLHKLRRSSYTPGQPSSPMGFEEYCRVTYNKELPTIVFIYFAVPFLLVSLILALL